MIEFDEKEAVKQAKAVLETYMEQKRRYTFLNPSPLQSPVITDLPRNPGLGNDLQEDWLDASREITAIEKAIDSLNAYGSKYSYILRKKYVSHTAKKPKSYFYNDMGYSESQYDRIMAEALVMFAESYRQGIIIRKIYKNACFLGEL